MKKIYYLLIITFLIQSCKNDILHPTIFEKGCGFDLENINFDENVSKLYSKHILNENDVEYDSLRDEKMTEKTLQYKISNTILDALKIKVPQKPFGYLYKTPEIDSIAKFQNHFFNTIYTLTNNSKKPIAYYAESIFPDLKRTKKVIQEITTKYGKPKYEFCISSDFNQCSYEWILKDKTLQIETSFGWSASFSSDGKNTNGKFYKLDLLIINNKYKEQIYKLHQYVFPEKILYNGKYISNKDIQAEKNSVFKDEFLLNSTFKHFIKNEYGLYSISNSKEE